MKKVLPAIMMLLMVFAAAAQEMPANPDPSLLDLSKAKASIAGPDKVYVRSLYYDGVEFSVLLEYDGADGAYAWGPYLENDKYLQDYVNLDYVYFRKRGSDEVNIYDVYAGGDEAYSGTVKWAGDRFKLQRFWASPAPSTYAEQIGEADKKLAQCKSENAENEKLITQGRAMIADYKAQISVLSGKSPAEIDSYEEKITKARKETADCMAKASRLESQLRAAQAGKPAMAVAEAMPGRTVLSGKPQGKILVGDWKPSAAGAIQADANQKYAKYEIPLAQRGNMLYGITGKASGTDWVGYGLHLFASGNKTAGRSYGYGNSFLVWVTRHPSYYQSDKTYLQIYRSFSDVRMVQVASVSIAEAIDSSLNIELLYKANDNTLIAYVNGKKKLEYETDSPLWSGEKVVVRTLGGPVEFSSFYVQAE